jgi:hypothetical protein
LIMVIFQAPQDNQDGISSVEAIPSHSCISLNRNNIREPWGWSVPECKSGFRCYDLWRQTSTNHDVTQSQSAYTVFLPPKNRYTSFMHLSSCLNLSPPKLVLHLIDRPYAIQKPKKAQAVITFALHNSLHFVIKHKGTMKAFESMGRQPLIYTNNIDQLYDECLFLCAFWMNTQSWEFLTKVVLLHILTHLCCFPSWPK